MTPRTEEIEAGLRCSGCGEPIPEEARYFTICVTDCSTGKRKHPRKDFFRDVTAIHSFRRYFRCAKCGPGDSP